MLRIEIDIDGTCGDVGRLMAATQSIALKTECVANEMGMVLALTEVSGQPFAADRIVVLAENARCPWRHEGLPDPRLLSIRARAVRFFVEQDS